ncbi:ankyrin repeat domain-containing protein [Aspergillus vadensis CBS 113365]|uniref:Ankyrin n=1 Tax=Aspergillus vadensis (strain CBS 113365 / IMI 142717 / IBT 24658) TaxID=1448311 RepID=A0A319B6I6_ASPVC|nr:ankyrin [Aspergillus vadensis CBS 113365]PYH67424.1 ankyrin [Aspergillus vadensis CBS 113365]
MACCYPRPPYNLDAGPEHQLMGWTAVGNFPAVAAIFDSPEGVDIPTFGETALHEAIRWGQTEILRYLISRGFDVNQKGPEPYGEICLTPMHFVAANNNAEMVDILLDAGADATIDDVSADGFRGILGGSEAKPHTPFMAAAFWGSHAVIDRLIERLPPVAIGSDEWPLAVAAAALHRHPKTLDILLRRYPSPGIPQDILDRALIDAAENWDYDPYHGIFPALPEESWPRGIDTFRLLLDRGARPNAEPPMSIYTYTPWAKDRPIIHATIDSSMGMDMVNMLLDHGVNLPEGSGGGAEDKDITLFGRAVRNGHPDLIRFFYQREGAVINMNEELPGRDRYFKGYLLHTAAASGRLANVQFLLDHGADPLKMNPDGYLPIHRACMGRHLDIIKLLWPLTCPAVPDLANYRTKDGQTAFHLTNCWSSSHYDPEVEKLSMRLLYFFKEQGADLSSLDGQGKSFLHHILPHHEDMIPLFRTLMEMGAQLRADAQGQTELHLTLHNPDWKLVGLRFLLAQGADKDINAQDNKGRTPLYYYLETHYYEPETNQSARHIREVVLDVLMKAGADPDIRSVSGKSARDLVIEKGVPYNLDE